MQYYLLCGTHTCDIVDGKHSWWTGSRQGIIWEQYWGITECEIRILKFPDKLSDQNQKL